MLTILLVLSRVVAMLGTPHSVCHTAWVAIEQ